MIGPSRKQLTSASAKTSQTAQAYFCLTNCCSGVATNGYMYMLFDAILAVSSNHSIVKPVYSIDLYCDTVCE